MRGAEAREAFSGASTGSTLCETRVETPETQRRARRRRAPWSPERYSWLGRSLVGQGAGGNPLMVCAITVQHRRIMNRQKQKERDFHPNW